MGMPVVNGAMLSCSFGMAPSTLSVLPMNRVMCNGQPMANILDSKPFLNVATAFEPYVGISPFDSNLFYSWLVPTLASWEDSDVAGGGDREIVCVVGTRDSSSLVGSVSDSRR